jgi:hypothetical protein
VDFGPSVKRATGKENGMDSLDTGSRTSTKAGASELARRRSALAAGHPQAVWGVIWEMLQQRPAERREPVPAG